MEKNGKFIELTLGSGKKVIVNMDAISNIKDGEASRVISFTNGKQYVVSNSYAELKEVTGAKNKMERDVYILNLEKKTI